MAALSVSAAFFRGDPTVTTDPSPAAKRRKPWVAREKDDASPEGAKEIPRTKTLRIHPNLRHHPVIFMEQDVAVIHERSRNIRIPEIHTHGHAVKRPFSAPVRHIDRVLQRGILHCNPINRRHQEVNLMHVKRMLFRRVILDRPVFHRADLGDNRRRLIRFEQFWLLSVDGKEEIYRRIRPQRSL